MGNRTQMIKDEETLREKIENDFEHDYFVEAGAGAGKTSLVVNRIARQLASGYKPEEIAAITFTNKAAQELRQRISDKVRKLTAADPSNTKLQAAALNIGKMQISTIHSFCHRILSEHCFEAALRLDFELLEEEDAQSLQRNFLLGWLNSHASEYQTFRNRLPEDSSLPFSGLLKNFQNICELPDDTNFVYEKYEDVSIEEDKKIAKEVQNNKNRLYSAFINAINAVLSGPEADGTVLEGRKYADAEYKVLMKSGEKPYNSDTLLTALKKGDINQLNSRVIGTKVKKQLDSLFQKVIDAVKKEYDEYIAVVQQEEGLKKTRAERESAVKNTATLDLLLKARADYRQQRFNRYITNDALLQKTEKLLDNEAIAEKVRRMFRCIYVDEFQDTDPIQNRLIFKLCKENGAFVPGKVFLVGDVKQSIYRFREADYRLFNAAKEIFEQNPAACSVVQLNINNRSNSDLVDFYNEKVSALDTLIPDYENMIPRNDYRTGDVLHGVYKVVNHKPEGEDPEQVAQVIRHLVGKASIEEYDPKVNEVIKRKAEYRDFLILTAKATKNAAYVDALQNAGIPARIALKYSPGVMRPLRRFALIYRYLVLPKYQRGLEGILEVAQDDSSDGNFSNKEALKAFADQVKDMSAAQIAGELLEKAELYLYSDEITKGNLAKRYQMAVRQMVDTVLSKTAGNAIAVSQAFMDYADESYECDREIGYDKTENAVRLMNIHKAKGLEGNIVIIAQRKDINEKEETYTEGKDRYQVTEIEEYGQSFGSPYALRQGIKDKADRERDMEAARLEYVAVTRAREALIFLDQVKDTKKDAMFANYIDDSIPELYDSFPLEDTGEESLPLEAIETGILHSEIPGEEVTRRAGYKTSPSEMENKSGGKKLEKKAEDQETEDPDDTEAPAETEASELLQKRPASDIFGTVMHRAFELSVHGIREGFVDPDLCINRAINENSDNIDARYKDKASDEKREYQQYLKERLPGFMRFITPFVIGADEVYTEYPFSLTVTGTELGDIRSKLQITEKLAESLPAEGTENDNSLWINGQADLVLKNGTDVVIWDYKSDKMNGLPIDEFSRHIHEKYDNQMNLYKWVFGKIFGGEAEGKFYSVEAGEI